MTSDGISNEDWDQVHELVLDVVNASDADSDQNLDRLFGFLRTLEAKYGERPSILATQADYALDRRESERLLLRAFDLALASGDGPNIREISLSLAELYATDLKQLGDAIRWLEVAGAYIRPESEADRLEYERIQSSIDSVE